MRCISVSDDVMVGTYVEKSGKDRLIKIELRFIDSLRFMRDSLDSLIGN